MLNTTKQNPDALFVPHRAAPPHFQAPPRPLCGTFSYLCLRFAQLASLLGAVLSPVIGILAFIRGEFAVGLVILFLATPMAIGQFVAFRMAVHYAERQS